MFIKVELLAYMGKFGRTGELFMDLSDLKQADDIPANWIDFVQGSVEERIATLVEYWKPIAFRLPGVIAFLQSKVYPPAILKEANGDISLLYPFKTAQGKVHLYQGYAPLGKVSDQLPLWKALPDDLKTFYGEIHNGWTYMADNAMGPLPAGDLGMLDQLIDLSPSEITRLSPSPLNTLRVFHNGAGSSVCLDLSRSQGEGESAGILWEKEEPDHLQRVGFWAIMNAWMEIFFENADVRFEQ